MSSPGLHMHVHTCTPTPLLYPMPHCTPCFPRQSLLSVFHFISSGLSEVSSKQPFVLPRAPKPLPSVRLLHPSSWNVAWRWQPSHIAPFPLTSWPLSRSLRGGVDSSQMSLARTGFFRVPQGGTNFKKQVASNDRNSHFHSSRGQSQQGHILSEGPGGGGLSCLIFLLLPEASGLRHSPPLSFCGLRSLVQT